MSLNINTFVCNFYEEIQSESVVFNLLFVIACLKFKSDPTSKLAFINGLVYRIMDVGIRLSNDKNRIDVFNKDLLAEGKL